MLIWMLAAAVQTPAVAAPDAKEILQKTLAAYSSAKSYQGFWTYTAEQGDRRRVMHMEVKARSPVRLLFRVTAGPAQNATGLEAIPEMQVVIDGKTAYFENTSDKVFYKVALPKNARISPLMFIPQIPAASQVERKDTQDSAGKTIHTLQAARLDGGISRMEVAAEGSRIRRIVNEAQMGPLKTITTISFEREIFDAEIPDREFTFRPARDMKEIPAPPGAAALFGAAGESAGAGR